MEAATAREDGGRQAARVWRAWCALLLGPLLTAPAEAKPGEVTYAQVFRDLARPSPLLDGARELSGRSLDDLPIVEEALYFFSAEEMESDLDEFSLDLMDEAYAEPLRELLRRTARVKGIGDFLDGRRSRPYDDVVVGSSGVLVLVFADEAGARRQLMVPVDPVLYTELVAMFEVDIPDTEAPFLGLLAGLADPLVPALRPVLVPPSGAPSLVEFLERSRRIGGALARVAEVEPADLPFLTSVPSARLGGLVAALAAEPEKVEQMQGPLLDLASGSDDEAAALAALLLHAAGMGGGFDLEREEERAFLEPRLSPVAAAALCGGLPPAEVGATVADDAGSIVCNARGRGAARALGELIARHPTALSWLSVPPGEAGEAFVAALTDAAWGSSPEQSRLLLRWALAPERQTAGRADAWVPLLRVLLADDEVRRSLPEQGRPTRLDDEMRDFLEELSASADVAAPWAALALWGAGHRSSAAWRPLVMGIGFPGLTEPCLMALRSEEARDPEAFAAFVRDLRKSGDPLEAIVGAFVRLLLVGEVDRKEITESLPLAVEGLARSRTSGPAAEYLDLMLQGGAEEAVLSAMARSIPRLSARGRRAVLIALYGAGRGDGEPARRVAQLVVRALDDPELSGLARGAVASRLAIEGRGPLVFELVGRLSPSRSVDRAACAAAVLLAEAAFELSLEETGLVVATLAFASENSQLAPLAEPGLRAIATRGNDVGRYWMWVFARERPGMRAVLAAAGA